MNNSNTLYTIALCLLCVLLGSKYYYLSPLHTKITKATAVMHPTKGNTTHGIVKFTETSKGLEISAKIEGLTEGKHGFHVHEFGDCGCDDAKCTGDHYNPTNQPHGGPTTEKQHVGDFGNIIADKSGVGIYKEVVPYCTLNGPRSIIGRGLIIHADPDDLVSQPTGNAGARIACGVIGIG